MNRLLLVFFAVLAAMVISAKAQGGSGSGGAGGGGQAGAGGGFGGQAGFGFSAGANAGGQAGGSAGGGAGAGSKLTRTARQAPPSGSQSMPMPSGSGVPKVNQ